MFNSHGPFSSFISGSICSYMCHGVQLLFSYKDHLVRLEYAHTEMPLLDYWWT